MNRLSLISLTNYEMLFVYNEWHHACLTEMNVHPSADNRHYNDIDYTFEQTHNIIKKYKKYPPPFNHYWDQLKLITNFYYNTYESQISQFDSGDPEILRHVYLIILSRRLPYLRYVEACILVADKESNTNNAVILSFCSNADWTRELMSFITYDKSDIVRLVHYN